MLNPQEVRIIAFVLLLVLTGTIVQSCKDRPQIVHRPESDVIKEHKFKKKHPTQAPD